MDDYFLGFLGLFFIVILPLIRLIIFLVNNKSRISKRTTFYKIIDRLIGFATLTTKHIQNNLEIQSPLIFYEQLYFLYFLEDLYSVGSKKSQSYRNSLLNCLINILNKTNKLDYLNNKDDFKKTFIKRYENYMVIFIQAKYTFSENFFDHVFEYQTAQIEDIKKYDRFTDFNPEITLLDYTPEECKIKSIVSENLSLLKSYLYL